MSWKKNRQRFVGDNHIQKWSAKTDGAFFFRDDMMSLWIWQLVFCVCFIPKKCLTKTGSTPHVSSDARMCMKLKPVKRQRPTPMMPLLNVGCGTQILSSTSSNDQRSTVKSPGALDFFWASGLCLHCSCHAGRSILACQSCWRFSDDPSVFL